MQKICKQNGQQQFKFQINHNVVKMMHFIVPLLLIFLVFQSYSQSSNYQTNCQIANIATNICIKCRSGFQQINNECVAVSVASIYNPVSISSNQLSITNQFSSMPVQSSVVSNYQSQNQVFIPGYLQSQNSSPPSNQPQNQDLLNLWAYLAAQQQASNIANTQNVYISNTPSSSSISSVSGGYTDSNCRKPDVSESFCSECYQSFYFNSTLGKCVTVNPLCKTYTGSNQCTSCYQGYDLSNGNCIASPTYKSPKAGDPNCKIKGVNDIGCSQCYSSFYFNSALGKCVLANSLCKKVTNNNKCTDCYPGYKLNVVQGTCVQDNSVLGGQSQSSSAGQKIQTPSGAGIDNQNSAIAAFLSQWLNNQNSAQNTQSSQASQLFFSSSASTASNTITQYGNYYYQFTPQGQLVRIYPSSSAITDSSTASAKAAPTTSAQVSDPYCTSYYNNICQGCQSGYYMTSSGCKSVDIHCIAWAGLSCSQCQASYIVSNGVCITQTAISINIPVSPAQTSQKCFYRQVFVNGKCTNVSDDCKQWDSFAQCTECYPGYTNRSGVCKL